jgi:hypothetical protein
MLRIYKHPLTKPISVLVILGLILITPRLMMNIPLGHQMARKLFLPPTEMETGRYM